MAKRSLFAGSTSIATLVRIFDVNGSPITGLVYSSTGLLAKYDVPGSATATITLATQTVSGAFSSGGFVEIDATAFPGLYRLDVPNAALASGPEVVISLYGYVGMSACMVEFDLWAVNPQDATAFGVSRIDALISSRMATFSLPTNFSVLSISATTGLVDITQTAADKVWSTAARTLTSFGTLVASIWAAVVDSSGVTTLLSRLTSGRATNLDNLDAAVSSRLAPAGTLATVTSLTNAPTAGDFTAAMKTSLNAATPAVTVSDKTGFSLSAAGIQAIWDALTSALTTAGSIGKRIVDYLTGDSYARLGAPAGASVSADVAAVKADTASIITTLSTLAAATATAVWAAGTRSLTTFGTLVADTAAAVWASASRTLTSFGTLVADIWASVADSSGVTTLLARLSAGRAANLDNLDVAVSTRFPTSSYIAPDNSGIAVAAAASASAATSAASANLKLGTPAGASVSADIAVIAGRVFRVKKNTALAGFQFPMTSAAGLGLTGLTVTAQRSLDGGALASCANAVSEISDGVYKIDLSASDLNADTVFLRFSATGAIDTTVTLVTQP